MVQKPRLYFKMTEVLHFLRIVKNIEVHSLQHYLKILFLYYMGRLLVIHPNTHFSFFS